jgi:23S rRNA pseudouridine2605 synthase
MLEAVGHAVSRLIRIRYGAMVLPRGLGRGGWMELDDADIRALMHAAGSRPVQSRGNEDAQTRSSRQSRDDGRPRRGRTGGPRGANNGQRAGSQGSLPSERRDQANQPDPMKTSFGYIGADSFTKQRQEAGQKPRGPQGGPRRNGRSR